MLAKVGQALRDVLNGNDLDAFRQAVQLTQRHLARLSALGAQIARPGRHGDIIPFPLAADLVRADLLDLHAPLLSAKAFFLRAGNNAGLASGAVLVIDDHRMLHVAHPLILHAVDARDGTDAVLVRRAISGDADALMWDEIIGVRIEHAEEIGRFPVLLREPPGMIS